MFFDTSLTALTLAVIWAVFYLVPPAQGLGDLVRIAFFHIPTAWVSVLAFVLSAWWSILYLKTRKIEADALSCRSAALGLIFCLLATISGAVFAKLTWGAYWNWDPRQITIFILLLVYGAYFALRSAIAEPPVRARLSAVYALFAGAAMPFLIFVIPRYYSSLHPEPVINASGHIDMDPVMLAVLLAASAVMTLIYLRLLFRRRCSA